jgi:predicted RNase H-like nuclease (RuvC/YqgF family)
MEGQEQALYTIAEAAKAWGISRQAVYKRLTTIDNQVDNQAFIVVKGKQRYITRDCIEAYRGEVNQVDNQPTTKRQPTDNQLTTEVDRLTRALLEEQGRASTLQGTVDAQRAHIDSLQAALDKTQTALNQEQQLHLATMQQRLPAGRGSSFMDWITSRGKKARGTE